MVVIGIVGTLIVLLLPAINSALEAGRRTQCAANQMKFAFAMSAYDSRNGSLPGWRNPLTMANKQCHVGWVVVLFPFLERTDVFQGCVDGRIFRGSSPSLPFVRCPSYASFQSVADNCAYRANSGAGTSNFPGDGVLADVSSGKTMGIADIEAGDGASTTILLAENNVWNTRWVHSNCVRTNTWWRAPSVPINPTTFPEGANFGGYWHIYWDYKQLFYGENPPLGGSSTEDIDCSGCFLVIPPVTTPDRIINNGAALGNNMLARYIPSSVHPGGAVVTFADGSTRFLRNELPSYVYAHLMTSRSAWDGTNYFTNSTNVNVWLKKSPTSPYSPKPEDYK